RLVTAASGPPENGGSRSRVQRTYLLSVAPDLRWANPPYRRRSTAPASFLAGSCWPRPIWRRDAWSAHSRPCCHWTSVIFLLGRNWLRRATNFAAFATGYSVHCKRCERHAQSADPVTPGRLQAPATNRNPRLADRLLASTRCRRGQSLAANRRRATACLDRRMSPNNGCYQCSDASPLKTWI